jgi:hypothetical protein
MDKFKLRETHFEKFSISKTNLLIKMGIEEDDLDNMLRRPKKQKHVGRKASLEKMIAAHNSRRW